MEQSTVKKLDAANHFVGGPESIYNKTVVDFWQWSFSDLMQNTTRGILAEYIVAALLEIDQQVRNPWFAYDLEYSDGRTIEIKTMSILQAWKQKKFYQPRVVLCPTRKWDPNTGIMKKESTFNADIYIFCFFKAQDRDKANPLDLKQWEFYVFTKKQIIELMNGRKSISLKTLQKKDVPSISAKNLKNKIESI